MKNAWVWSVLAFLIGTFLPEFADVPSQITQGLLTSVGYMGLVTLLTEIIKPFAFKVWDFKHLSIVLSLLIALLLGYGSWLLNYGIFDSMAWFEVLVQALIAWISANKWYDWTLK